MTLRPWTRTSGLHSLLIPSATFGSMCCYHSCEHQLLPSARDSPQLFSSHPYGKWLEWLDLPSLLQIICVDCSFVSSIQEFFQKLLKLCVRACACHFKPLRDSNRDRRPNRPELIVYSKGDAAVVEQYSRDTWAEGNLFSRHSCVGCLG